MNSTVFPFRVPRGIKSAYAVPALPGPFRQRVGMVYMPLSPLLSTAKKSIKGIPTRPVLITSFIENSFGEKISNQGSLMDCVFYHPPSLALSNTCRNSRNSRNGGEEPFKHAAPGHSDIHSDFCPWSEWRVK